jgi:hypothetical protein
MENKTVRAPCPHCVKQEEEERLKKGIMPLKRSAGARKSCWPTIEFFEWGVEAIQSDHRAITVVETAMYSIRVIISRTMEFDLEVLSEMMRE